MYCNDVIRSSESRKLQRSQKGNKIVEKNRDVTANKEKILRKKEREKKEKVTLTTQATPPTSTSALSTAAARQGRSTAPSSRVRIG
jgi:hypothetical protein